MSIGTPAWNARWMRQHAEQLLKLCESGVTVSDLVLQDIEGTRHALGRIRNADILHVMQAPVCDEQVRSSMAMAVPQAQAGAGLQFRGGGAISGAAPEDKGT